jgi:hypothetical protein
VVARKPLLLLAENGGTATITATLNNLSVQNVTANLAFTGTATAGTDYTKSDSIVILAGDTSNTITLNSSNDALDEDNETIIVNINSVTNGTEMGTPTNATQYVPMETALISKAMW